MLATAVSALALAAGTNAAAAAPTTAPSAWVHTVCASVVAWDRHITTRAASLHSLNGHDVPGVKRKLVAFLAGVVSDTQALISTVDAAGAPSIPNGAAAAKALHQGLAQTKSFFALDVTKAQKLPVSPAGKFAAGATALGRSIDVQAQKIGKTFSSLDKRFPSSALDKAFKTDAACSSLK
jgi:hypothetical protein